MMMAQACARQFGTARLKREPGAGLIAVGGSASHSTGGDRGARESLEEAPREQTDHFIDWSMSI
jgi:hypothetical protein